MLYLCIETGQCVPDRQQPWRCDHRWRRCASSVRRLNVVVEFLSYVRPIPSISKDRGCQHLHMKAQLLSCMCLFMYSFWLFLCMYSCVMGQPIGSYFEIAWIMCMTKYKLDSKHGYPKAFRTLIPQLVLLDAIWADPEWWIRLNF